MDIRFIALNGSERARGTTARCLDLARAYLETRSCDFEIIHLAEQEIRQCSCGRCNSRPDPCPVVDDTGEIVARMKAADAIVYAAPVHGFGLAGVPRKVRRRSCALAETGPKRTDPAETGLLRKPRSISGTGRF